MFQSIFQPSADLFPPDRVLDEVNLTGMSADAANLEERNTHPSGMVIGGPLSSEYGAYKTVKPRFWLGFSGESASNL